MAKNTCKLCSRRFGNPRALAGHMRSHSVSAAAAAAARSQISSTSSASTSIAAGDDDGGGDAKTKKPIQGYVLGEKPKRRVRLAESSDFSDRESESEYYSSSSPPHGKRANTGSGGGDAEQVSSVSDAGTSEEDFVAMSLIMLSRDTWPSPPPPPLSSYHGDEPPAPAAAQKRTRFQCPACKKVFRSYQALGGHRASHIRGGRGGCCAPPPINHPPPSPATPLQPLPEFDVGGGEEDGGKPHECPYCFRVFASGQALGGHKRSQLCSAAAAAAAADDHHPATGKSNGFIDLNLPAPFDDVELSAVSDPFLSSKPGS
uniref:C2H2-type domain-containing protein n=1 Tax=Leersia perrieri TaxID=77586 RepID=A0A0D9W7Z1_9ORYZ